MTILRGREHLTTKINITFFVRNEVLKIFYLTVQKKIYSKITARNNFWGAWPFLREWGVRWQKWISPFLWEMGYWILFSNFFRKKYRAEWKPKNQFWGHISHISVVLLGRLFPKTIGFTHWWTRTNHVNFRKIGSKVRPVSCVLICMKYKVSFQSVRCSRKMNFAETDGEVDSFWFVPLSLDWKRKVCTIISCFKWSTAAYIQWTWFFVFTRNLFLVLFFFVFFVFVFFFFWIEYNLELVSSYIILIYKYINFLDL